MFHNQDDGHCSNARFGGLLRNLSFRVLITLSAQLMCSIPVRAADPVVKPPYRGTIFEFKELMADSDPTAFRQLEYIDLVERQMFDRRIDRFETFPVFLFHAEFHDSKQIEVAVNQEFGSEQKARAEALFYVQAFGRLPLMLRREIDALHIQSGQKLFGGGRNILIHTEQGREYDRAGILEETLAHEAAHALDERHARHQNWLTAQTRDNHFISTYAEENPFREDIAESVVPFFAVRFRPERIKAEQRQVIETTIPARISYFDSLKPDGFPTARSDKSADDN